MGYGARHYAGPLSLYRAQEPRTWIPWDPIMVRARQPCPSEDLSQLRLEDIAPATKLALECQGFQLSWLSDVDCFRGMQVIMITILAVLAYNFQLYDAHR